MKGFPVLSTVEYDRLGLDDGLKTLPGAAGGGSDASPMGFWELSR